MLFTILKGIGKAIVGLGVIGLGLVLILVSLGRLSTAVEDFRATRATVLDHHVLLLPMNAQSHVGGRSARAGIVYKFMVAQRPYIHPAHIVEVQAGDASSTEANAKTLLSREFPVGSEIVVYYDPDKPGDSRLAKAVNRGLYALLGFGIILVVSMGLALIADFTAFLGEFFPGAKAVSRFLAPSIDSLMLGITAVVILLLLVSGFFHDPLLDPLGIERTRHIRVASVVVVLFVVAVGIRFFKRRSSRA